MPIGPTTRPLTGIPRIPIITDAYARTRVQTNETYNDEVRRYNALLWDRPMTRRNVFKLPVNHWTGRPGTNGLPKKMSVIRLVQAAQWLQWAPALNLAIVATDTLQAMVDRYLLWLGLPPGANRVNRA
jgi:hypothetical protein